MIPNDDPASVPASNLPDLRELILAFDVVVEALASGVILSFPTEVTLLIQTLQLPLGCRILQATRGPK